MTDLKSLQTMQRTLDYLYEKQEVMEIESDILLEKIERVHDEAVQVLSVQSDELLELMDKIKSSELSGVNSFIVLFEELLTKRQEYQENATLIRLQKTRLSRAQRQPVLPEER